MNELLVGRTAIVTGAGRGIGRGEALALAAQGATVIVNDVDESFALDVVDEIEALGGKAIADSTNVVDFDAVEALVDKIYEQFGSLDIVVNNAGILRDRMLVNMTEREWDDVIGVHLKGTFCLTKHAAARWRLRSKAGESVYGRVINTTSVAGLCVAVGQTNYGAAKAGIASFTLNCAAELWGMGVTVNAVAPGALTRMTENLPGAPAKAQDGEFDKFDPENVAPIVVWLASPEAAQITGHILESSYGVLSLFTGWQRHAVTAKEGRFDLAELSDVVAKLREGAPQPAPLTPV